MDGINSKSFEVAKEIVSRDQHPRKPVVQPTSTNIVDEDDGDGDTDYSDRSNSVRSLLQRFGLSAT